MPSSLDIIIIGNVCADPTQRQVGENTVTNFNVAVNFKRGNKDEVLYCRIAAWNKLGDVALNYVHKGDAIKVYADYLRLGTYNNDPQVDFTASNITLLGTRRTNAAGVGQHASQGGPDDVPF